MFDDDTYSKIKKPGSLFTDIYSFNSSVPDSQIKEIKVKDLASISEFSPISVNNPNEKFDNNNKLFFNVISNIKHDLEKINNLDNKYCNFVKNLLKEDDLLKSKLINNNININKPLLKNFEETSKMLIK